VSDTDNSPSAGAFALQALDSVQYPVPGLGAGHVALVWQLIGAGGADQC
jgi:hypothetical protein